MVVNSGVPDGSTTEHPIMTPRLQNAVTASVWRAALPRHGDTWMDIRVPCVLTYIISFIPKDRPHDVTTQSPDDRRGRGSGMSSAHRHACGQVQTQGGHGQVHAGPSNAHDPGFQELQLPPNSQPHATFLREEFRYFWMDGAQIPKLGKPNIHELFWFCQSES